MRWMKSESGQSVIEMALVLPMLLVVCIGMAELGRATWAWNMAQMAASEAARRSIVISNGAWADTARAAARSILYGRDGTTEKMFAGAGVQVLPTLDKSQTPYILTVDVDVPIRLVMDFWTLKGYNIHGHASMPVQPAFVDN